MNRHLVGKAYAFAFEAHWGHVDKSGEVYATHLVRVAARFEDDAARAVALLHDTVEAPIVTEAEVRAQFPVEIADAVMALTKRGKEPLESYLARVAENELAIRVKRADIADNASPARLEKLPQDMQTRLHAKYARARALLDAFETGVGVCLLRPRQSGQKPHDLPRSSWIRIWVCVAHSGLTAPSVSPPTSAAYMRSSRR